MSTGPNFTSLMYFLISDFLNDLCTSFGVEKFYELSINNICIICKHCFFDGYVPHLRRCSGRQVIITRPAPKNGTHPFLIGCVSHFRGYSGRQITATQPAPQKWDAPFLTERLGNQARVGPTRLKVILRRNDEESLVSYLSELRKSYREINGSVGYLVMRRCYAVSRIEGLGPC